MTSFENDVIYIILLYFIIYYLLCIFMHHKHKNISACGKPHAKGVLVILIAPLSLQNCILLIILINSYM